MTNGMLLAIMLSKCLTSCYSPSAYQKISKQKIVFRFARSLALVFEMFLRQSAVSHLCLNKTVLYLKVVLCFSGKPFLQLWTVSHLQAKRFYICEYDTFVDKMFSHLRVVSR